MVDVRVTGHQLEIGDSLRELAVGRMQSLTKKYFSRAVAANVTMSPGPHNDFVCDIVAPVAQGVVLKAHHRAPEANIAFEGAGDKIEKQLRRYAKRLKDHKGNGAADDFVESAGYTIFAPASDRDTDAEEMSDHPAIIAETKVDIPEASVSDAVMMLDLRNTNALMFKNRASGELNMIYRRDDGNIGWVEPPGR